MKARVERALSCKAFTRLTKDQKETKLAGNPPLTLAQRVTSVFEEQDLAGESGDRDIGQRNTEQYAKWAPLYDLMCLCA